MVVGLGFYQHLLNEGGIWGGKLQTQDSEQIVQWVVEYIQYSPFNSYIQNLISSTNLPSFILFFIPAYEIS